MGSCCCMSSDHYHPSVKRNIRNKQPAKHSYRRFNSNTQIQIHTNSNTSPSPIPNINSKDTNKRIESMLNWFIYTMTDPETHRFYYEYNFEDNILSHQSCPIRDLGTAWNASNVITYISKTHTSHAEFSSKFEALSITIKNTINYYLNSNKALKYYTNNNEIECAYIDSLFINEHSNIAHSAFVILSTISAYNTHIIDMNSNNNICKKLQCLVNGILTNQNINKLDKKHFGAFTIDFEGKYGYYNAIEFCPAEALLSLLSYYQYLSKLNNKNNIVMQSKIIDSVVHAFGFYSKYFYNGNISSDYIIFWSNWQTQLFSLLLDVLIGNNTMHNRYKYCTNKIAKYVIDLQNNVLISNTFNVNLNPNGKRYGKIATVEVACGLESLCDGLKCAYYLKDIETAKRICDGIEKSMMFLNTVQRLSNIFDNNMQNKSVEKGIGGFGNSMNMSTQRIDVTGHVTNAYIKVMQLMR